jgi:branched-chain amino acid transport system ATP-binding protein
LPLANQQAGSLTLLQRKRLELGRALATGPRLLLLDEIAGGLTEAEVLELVDLIVEIRATGVAVVWIEHIVHALLRVVDRMIAINFGVKVAEGDPQEVMASDAVRAVYLGQDVATT